MHVSPSFNFDDLWLKQISNLRQQLNVFFSVYRIGIDRKMNFQSELNRIFKETFSIPLPSYIEQRAIYEREIILSIHRQLKQDQLILRRFANQTNIFYLGSIHDWERKTNEYMEQTTSYELMATIDENNPLQPQVDEMAKSIEYVLITMRQKRLINDQHLTTMQLKKSNYQLPTLYFLPELQQDSHIVVQPMISACNRCPIKSIARFLDNLLTPLVDSHTRATTVSNGNEFIHRLVPYDITHLLPKTRFVTYKVKDFYQLFSHHHLLDALGDFLIDVLPVGRHQNLTLNAIQELTCVVLRNNMFVYQNHIYRYIKRSPLSLPLIRTLGNIYLHQWQKSLVNQLGYFGEFYTRYHDIGFLTWNHRPEKLQAALNELNSKHPDIHIDTTVDSSAVFLGAYVKNQYGKLYTRVHHDSNVPSFVLPYVIGHPRLLYRQWFQWAMRRAVRYSTTSIDFDQERLLLELTLLANGYSLEFVQMNLSLFFNKYFITTPPVHMDIREYETLRNRVLNAIVLEEEYRQTQQKWKMNNQLVQLNYYYDWGLRWQFNEQFKKIWLDLIKNDKSFANIDLKLKLNTIHCYPLNALFSS